jgi:hypothetical protein
VEVNFGDMDGNLKVRRVLSVLVEIGWCEVTSVDKDDSKKTWSCLKSMLSVIQERLCWRQRVRSSWRRSVSNWEACMIG